MSFALDVNILLDASDQSSAEHERAVRFLHDRAAGQEIFYLAWITVMSYLRIATHPRIFQWPLSHEEAARNIEALLGLPHCRVIGEGDGFWSIYRATATDVPTRGNLVPDAHLAALLRSTGVNTLYTRDRDFRKFPGLRAVDPLE